MSERTDNVATSNKARRPKEIVKMITDTGSVSNLRKDLSEMIIAWQHYNDESHEKKEEMFLAFMLLDEALRDMEVLQEGRMA